MKRGRDSFQTPFKTVRCLEARLDKAPIPTCAGVDIDDAAQTTLTIEGAYAVKATKVQAVTQKSTDLIEDILYWLDVTQRAAEVLSEDMNQPIDAILTALRIPASSVLFEDGEFCRPQ